ncbi:malto-oligosyltrehalose trehalohydrolase [Wenjunlia tyrosinilytica]|uniref:malto-oligosyltrehalose trehalohydrolase n=1 Tax=Wenjunlia tyrosinilytica TaxID=1544741 RepID=UPI001669A77B|nr:malto-oligosyltrehalose trehalohydrolase [Wenjunlia tyrosinilytica]
MAFDVWAPHARRVALEAADRRYPMREDAGRPGWWHTRAEAGDGTEYGFRLDGGGLLPDPRSRRQPHGPHGASQVVDHGRFAWTDDGWPGRALPGGVVYELHVGTFTKEGTFDAAAERLDHLVRLGVTHVELMPVCPFPGTHGWGYEGVSLWAVHEPYGGPDGLKRFVDAAHGRGLAVLLDVVHNHLGPSGNYLPAFGPYFTDTHHTPWGSAVNLDAPGSDEVRDYLLGSALAWLRDYHLDGLRLDAVHALADTRALHFLEELSTRVDALSAALGRPLTLIAESDLNDPRTTASREAGGLGLHAQWSDDFHHALHTALTGERQGYYADFAEAPLAALAKTLTRVWLHDGTWSSFRGRHHGRPVDPLRASADRFLGYAQTHDQVGNRAVGDRLPACLSPGLLAVAAGLVLTSPFTPMLFMGEEWGAGTPWQFFTDHTDPELAQAVSRGRRREFAAHGWSEEEVPDPQDRATWERSCLDWSEPERAPHSGLLDWYRELLALRRTEPELTDPDLSAVRVDFDELGRWLVMRRGSLRVAANLTNQPRSVPLSGIAAQLLAASGPLGLGASADLELPGETLAVIRTD